MIQRYGIDFSLISTVIIIFVFCITEDNAGVVLRNFKSRRMIMEEEEKALKGGLRLNLTNSTVVSNEILMDKRTLNNSSDKTTVTDELTVGLKNRSQSQTKNLKVTSKKKILTSESLKSMVTPQTKNKIRKASTLMNSFVENRGMRRKNETSIYDNTNKPNFQQPIILTNSVLEYLDKRVEETILESENDKNTSLISVPKMNESAPFRLISLLNKSVVTINEISGNSVDIDGNKEMSEVEEIFTVLHELDNHTLKNTNLDGKQNTENWQQFDKRNNTNIVKEISNAIISELSDNSFSKMFPKRQEKENNVSRMLEESETTDLKNFAKHEKKFEIMIPLNDLISKVHIESKNFTINITNEDTKKSLDDGERINLVKPKETNDNKSSINRTQSEEGMMVKPFEQQEPSDLIKKTAKEIENILPASNKTIIVENIEEFVENLTDTVQSMADEDINLEPEDEQISQSTKNKDTINQDNISATILNDTLNEFELNLESVVSSGIDFLVNSEVAKNAAIAMEVFNLSDSSLTDHVIEDSDVHSFIDIMMPSVSHNEIESILKESTVLNETTKSNVEKKNFTLNSSLDIANKTLESATMEKKCPTPGICIFWFMGRDSCSDHKQCMGEKICCRVRCSKSCIDI